MKSALALCCLLAGAPAAAPAAPPADAGSAGALDLSLPDSYRNDPPGTWYGDTSGVPGSGRQTAYAGSRCPTSPQGEPREVTGSVAAGIGHGSGHGTSRWNAAELNYCKEYAREDGGTRTFNLNLNVGRYDGPAPYPYGYGPYPYGYGPYDDGYGPRGRHEREAGRRMPPGR